MMNIFSNQNIKIFLPDNDSLNDATAHYIYLIEKAIVKAGGSSIKCKKITDIHSKDIVITIQLSVFIKYFFFFLIKRNQLVHWLQSISPEEAQLSNPNILLHPLRVLAEILVLRISKKLFLGAESMLRHYESKYNLKIQHKSIIIPCYNKHLQRDTFFIANKYATPSFVYAGSLSAWQCFEETVEIYKKIEDTLDNSKLTVLTAEEERAKIILKEKGIQRFEVKYVPLIQLDNELSKHKYGFLIRKEHIVNYVATPTKMNSYLSVGLIPIFTDAVADFNTKINLQDYELKISSDVCIDDAVNKILSFEKNNIVKTDKYYNIVKCIFDNYYSDEKNLDNIIINGNV
ncbi:hypothetical protein [Capnocytophaga sputigena]|uniref:hypothetical protein n=1 Tax=Capnocytophaga sputigena TaxID=1019 RepID=UPI000BB58485|nr:hypothetical protein [Capnocytophaga sputigena]PBN47936.1 hypothetical protein CDC50_05095 [Capnocytophaga sputigena]